MDFDTAILAHTRWKRRLHASMAEGAPLDAEQVGRDRDCDLGRWIAQEQARLADRAEYRALEEAHAAFHRAAARVAREINEGHLDQAHRLMGFDSEFSRRSLQVIEAIGRLRQYLLSARD